MPTPRAKGPPSSRHYPLVGLLDSESRAVQSRGNNDTLALVSFTENASECLRYSSSLWGPVAPPVGPRALRVWEPRDTIPSAGAFVKWLSSPSPLLSLSSLSLSLSLSLLFSPDGSGNADRQVCALERKEKEREGERRGGSVGII